MAKIASFTRAVAESSLSWVGVTSRDVNDVRCHDTRRRASWVLADHLQAFRFAPADFPVSFTLSVEGCYVAPDNFERDLYELLEAPWCHLELIDYRVLGAASGKVRASFVLHPCHDGSGRTAPDVVREFTTLVDLQSSLLSRFGSEVRIAIQPTPYKNDEKVRDLPCRPVGIRVPPPQFLLDSSDNMLDNTLRTEVTAA